MDRNWRLTLRVGIVAGLAIGVVQLGEGRPVPDETLGEERSIFCWSTVKGQEIILFESKLAVDNLFHRFFEFELWRDEQGGFVRVTNIISDQTVNRNILKI